MIKKAFRALVGVAVAATLFVGNPLTAPAAFAAFCKFAPTLANSATYTPKVTYPTGATFGYYSMPTGVGTGSNYPTRITVFKGQVAKYNMSTPHAPLGLTGNQRTFANSIPNLATYVNTDFIGSNNMPYSAIITGGRMIYAPAPHSTGDPAGNDSTRVIGWARQTFSESAGFAVAAPLKSGTINLSVSGVNLKSIPANSIVAFTAKDSTKTIPRGAYAILVSKNKVVISYLKGTNIRPTLGTLFQASGTMVARLKKLTKGKAAVYSMPPLTKASLVADTVAPTGYIGVGNQRILIKAINFQGDNNSGATLYDSNFGGVQTVGAATFQTDSTGKVLTVSPSRGVRITINPGRYIFQVARDQSNLVSSIQVGQTLKIVDRFSSVGKNKILEASGRGSLLITDGVNVEDCVGASEDIRPRTVIGWNASGDFWVATSTMGQHWDDGLYRLGGSTIHQMGEWLKELGATQAVSVDGGGSTAHFVTINGVVTRQDLPENEWIRDIPVGMAFSPVD